MKDMNADYNVCWKLNSMEDMNADYNIYWKLNRWDFGSSSPDIGAGASSCLTNEKTNTVLERNRRRKLSAKLYNLRGVVPNITKLDKPSIIKDAIVYIEGLQKEERRMMSEIFKIESYKAVRPSINGIIEQDESVVTKPGKRGRLTKAPNSPTTPSIKVVMELRVCDVGDRILTINLSCKKEGDTMMNICDVFRSLNLKIITANLTNLSGNVFHTLFVESEGMSCDLLKEKIEIAIAKLDAKINPPISRDF